MANRLWALGVEVIVLERAPGPRERGYMIDFYGPGYDAIKAMGLLPQIEDVAYRVTEASFVDEQGRRRVGVSLDSFAVGPLLSITRPDLERVLREQLRVDIQFGVSPVAVTETHDSVRVTLDNGTELEADLLVGADGIHSTVRRLVFGDESRFLPLSGLSHRRVHLRRSRGPRDDRRTRLPDRHRRQTDGLLRLSQPRTPPDSSSSASWPTPTRKGSTSRWAPNGPDRRRPGRYQAESCR